MPAPTIAARAEALLDAADPFGVGLVAPDVLDAELATACALLHDAVREDDGLDPVRTAATIAELERHTRLRGRVLDLAGGLAARRAPGIHDALARLRSASTVAELLPAAVAELGASCGFDRAVVSRLRGSAWRAEAVWIAPGQDPDVSAATVAFLTDDWIALGPGALETEIVQRRVACVVDPSDPRTNKDLMAASRTSGYAAAPVISGDRVVGFLQADCFGSGRRLGEPDREAIRTFAEGFGYVFERVARLELLERRRLRLERTVDAATRSLAALSRDESSLARGERVTGTGATSAVRSAPTRVEQLLTVREREVADLLVTGARNAQIAVRLVITEDTVKSHVRTIARKLEASGRADVVARYLRLVLRETR